MSTAYEEPNSGGKTPPFASPRHELLRLMEEDKKANDIRIGESYKDTDITLYKQQQQVIRLVDLKHISRHHQSRSKNNGIAS